MNYKVGTFSDNIGGAIKNIPGEFDKKIFQFGLRLEDIWNTIPDGTQERIENYVFQHPELIYCYADMVLGVKILDENFVEYQMYEKIYLICFLCVLLAFMIFRWVRNMSDRQKHKMNQVLGDFLMPATVQGTIDISAK